MADQGLVNSGWLADKGALIGWPRLSLKLPLAPSISNWRYLRATAEHHLSQIRSSRAEEETRSTEVGEAGCAQESPIHLRRKQCVLITPRITLRPVLRTVRRRV